MTVLHQGPCATLTLDQGIARLVLHREPANEIGTSMLSELEVVRDLCRSGREDVRALVTSSSLRRGFSAGADLRELHRGNQRALAEGWSDAQRRVAVEEFLLRIHDVFDSLDEAPFVTVAAVHGVVFGGGLELMLAHDVVIADRSARFAFPELRLGVIPGFGGLPRLCRDVGNAVVRDLLFTGRSLGAERAYQTGLVAQVAGDGRALEVALRTAQQATRFDPRTVRSAKRFAKPFPKAELARERAIFCELFTSDAVTEALAAFDASTAAMPYLPAGKETR